MALKSVIVNIDYGKLKGWEEAKEKVHSSTSENPSGNLAHIFPNEFRLSRKKYVSYFKRFVYEVSPVELRMERCENAKERANERTNTARRENAFTAGTKVSACAVL